MQNCRDCGSQYNTGKSLCNDCLNKAKVRMKVLRAAAIQNGLCGKCRKNKFAEGQTRCQVCIDKENNAGVTRRKKYLFGGKCEKCGKDKDDVAIWHHNWCAKCQLKHKFNYDVPREDAAEIINNMLKSQDYRCALTGRCLKTNKFHIDHINPRSKGGENKPDNWQLIIEDANMFKKDIGQSDLLSIVKDIAIHHNLFGGAISNARNCNFNDLLIWNGNKLTTKFIKTQTKSARLQITQDIYKFFLAYEFFETSYSDKVVGKDLESLLRSNIDVEVSGDTKLVTNSSSTGTRVLKSFFPNMLKSTDSSKKKSVYECVSDPLTLYQICYNRMANYRFLNNKETGEKDFEYFTITPAMILQGAKSTGLASRGSIFKPSVAKVIYSNFVKDGDIVYDYSAGFGSRMLGMYASGIKAKYYAAEPNTETYKNLNILAKHLGMNAEILNECSEDVVLNQKIDFAFSSPPYFNHEIYCDEATQCYNKFKNYKDWLEGYWRETVRNIKKMSKPSTVFGVNAGNLSNKKMKSIYEDMTRIIEEEGFALHLEWSMKTARSHFDKGTGPKLEPICFYKLR